jgi:cytochrome c oxidase subunit 2
MTGRVTAVILGAVPDPNALDPGGDGASILATVWWILLGLATAVFVIVLTLILVGALRHQARVPGSPDRFIAVGGAVVPAIVLTVVAIVTVRSAQDLSAAPADPLRITVDAAQWFWRVDYDGTPVVTANELHVPVGRPVEISLVSHDVIHSFWVPQLAGKVDVIPGQTNTIHFTADRAGTYRGQCAEFCGLQHAHMAFLVIADPPAEFSSWLAAYGTPSPTSAQALRGKVAFEQQACAGCHRIAGTPAQGSAGPDLTDLARRQTIAAGTLPNTPADLRSFIADPQSAKPGVLMPQVPLTDAQIDDIVAYLETTKP